MLRVPEGASTPRLRVERNGQRSPLRLALYGELDIATAPTLERVLTELADLEGELTIDVSAVRFIDSTGLRAILACAAKRRLTLSSPSPPVRRMLQVTGLLERLTAPAIASPPAGPAG